ncbi:MAG: TlpA disulfide reductase family protein [Gammaproteobacteria bacterium]
MSVSIDGEEISVSRYPAEGTELLLWIAPGYGTDTRFRQIAPALVQRGIDVWYVDLAESLFLTKTTQTMRSLDGRYIQALISYAQSMTGKSITLLSRSYGAIPALRGARLWQLSTQAETTQSNILNGVILFSPELYQAVPPLGTDPEYVPIASVSTAAVMIYQAGKRNTRWRLPGLLQIMGSGGAQVFSKILRGVTGVFYEKDLSSNTQMALLALPEELSVIIQLLKKTQTPLQTQTLQTRSSNSTGIDIAMQAFQGNPEPLPLMLETARGEKIHKQDYQGKVSLVNFWASWCGPCVEEIPSLNRLREKMADKPFELISVNYAESNAIMQAFLKQVQVDFPVLMDRKGEVAADWNVMAFPSTFVIGPDGRIVYGVNAAIEWDAPEIITQLNALIESHAEQSQATDHNQDATDDALE